jgi:tetratricopeptide (TPR) repeat protein
VLPIAAQRYSIVLRVAYADSGGNLITVVRAADDRNLIPTVQAAAREVRRRLGERRDAIAANTPLVQVATPSFPAYRKYVEAVGLSEQGEVATSNRLLQEALALDTGFASAWATIASNYLTMHNLDSAGLALAQALKRPTRLNDAQRYRLLADADYTQRYDIPGALRWYDLLLQIAPASISGHNNRATLLYSLGRYEEALRGFRRTEELEPFGPEQAQIEIFNQTVTLLALGRDVEAATIAGKLRGRFSAYAAELLATYRGDWSAAERQATKLTEDPSTPSWLRVPAVTMRAGALAARGAVTAATDQLRAAAVADAPVRPWFCNAVLLLAAASGHKPGPVPPWLLADTTAGGLVVGGLWAAMSGDITTARRRQALLQRKPPVEQKRLGLSPALLGAYLLAATGQWNQVVPQLRDIAVTGELDGGDLAQVSSMAVRWLSAESYERTGKPDSASMMYRLVLDPSRTPFSHLALRGLVEPFARHRLAQLVDKPDHSS